LKFYAGRFVLTEPPNSFIQHNHLEKGLRSDLLIGLVMFMDNEKPVKYLFPSTVWETPNQLFTNSAVSHAEYGISVKYPCAVARPKGGVARWHVGGSIFGP
jgi:hypothetical protein